MKKRLQKTKWLVLLFYGAALAGWLGLCLIHFVGDRQRTPQLLDVSTAETASLLPQPGGGYHSETTDPQLVFTNIHQKTRLVRLQADFAIAPGEMELFYTRDEADGFSARRRVIGVPQPGGGYLYTLPAGNIAALRVDPGTAGGNNITIHEIELNPVMPVSYYFVPSLRTAMALLLWPPLALCAFILLGGIVHRAVRRRRDRQKSPM